MALFQDKKGEWHDSQHHTATFKGSHNSVKSKVLIYLLHRYKRGLGGLSAREIALYTGVKLSSLKSLLNRWVTWHYVQRRVSVGVRPCYSYSISERGARFVSTRIPDYKYNQYVTEINEHNRNKGR